LAREADAEGIAIVGSKMVYLIGPRGKRFIDFTSGWSVGNFGWNDRGIRAALRNFNGPTYVYPSYRYEVWDELAALLGDLAPGNLTHCFRATGGSEAVDILNPREVLSVLVDRKRVPRVPDRAAEMQIVELHFRARPKAAIKISRQLFLVPGGHGG
jgi:hypothetical protein